MQQEQVIQEILEIVQFIRDNAASKADVDILKDDVGTIKNDFDILKGDVGSMRGDIDILKGDVGSIRGDIVQLDTKIENFKSEVIEHVDGLAVLMQTRELELVALQAKSNRTETHVQQLADHLEIQLQY